MPGAGLITMTLIMYITKVLEQIDITFSTDTIGFIRQAIIAIVDAITG